MTAASYSRRSFGGRLGIGAGAMVAGGGVMNALAAPADARPARSRFVATGPTTFGRLGV